jgi:glycerophosphoryl diester phosphodiesterase
MLIFMSLAAPSAILVHGHRGARAVMPENTLPAFQYAIREGADFIELDLAVTKDNILVVSHDLETNDTICRGPKTKTPIRQLTFAELQQWDCGAMGNPGFPQQKAIAGTRMPSLDEVLKATKGSRVQFNIETKINPNHPELTPEPKEFARLLLEQLRRHKVEKRTIVQSFDFRTLTAMRELEPSIRLSALWDPRAKDWLKQTKELGFRIVSPHFLLITPEIVREAHTQGIQVVPWTANTPDIWAKLRDAQVDAIITDDPAGLIAFLRKP